MADFTFDHDISGTESLIRYYENWGLLYISFLTDFLQAAGIKAQKYTIQNTNVGTHGPIYNMTGGSLRRAWTLTPVKRRGLNMEITLFADPGIAPYAIYVEEGHRTLAYSPTTGKRLFFQLPDGSWRASTNGWVEGQHMARDAFEKVAQGMTRAYTTAFRRFEARIRSRGN